MNFLKTYLKLFVLLAIVIGIFYALQFSSGSEKGLPVPVITSTNVTNIREDGYLKIKTEVEIKNNGGKGYVVVTVKATTGNETLEKNVDILMKPKKTQTLKIIFDDKNIVNKNPKFDFTAYPFIKK